MLYRPADSRLLSNLLTHEKDYSKHLENVLDSSNASINSLIACGASGSTSMLRIASALSSVDDALRMYAAAVVEWRTRLTALKDMEDEVGSIMRDKEIIVTRLLKASKNTKNHHRDSLSFSSNYSPTSSTLSIKSDEQTSFNYKSSSPTSLSFIHLPISGSRRIHEIQNELKACEDRLNEFLTQLDDLRVRAVEDGMNTRFAALAACGRKWASVGDDIVNRRSSISPNTSEKPLPHPEGGTPSDLSSLAPSQSASQINVNPQVYDGMPHLDQERDVLVLPAPHNIDNNDNSHLRHVLPRRITEEDLNASDSDEEEVPVAVVENVSPRFRERKSNASFFGSLKGLFSRRDGSEDNSDGAYRGRIPAARKDNEEIVKTLRRRSASMDAVTKDLNVNMMRAEEWVGRQEEHNEQKGKKLVRDGSVRRRKSTRRKPENTPTGGLTRSSSLMSAPAAMSSTIPKKERPSSMPSTNTGRRLSTPLSDRSPSPTKKERRASSPLSEPSSSSPVRRSSVGHAHRPSMNGNANESLMSIVEGVAKARGEETAAMRSVEENLKPLGMIDIMKAPPRISRKELEDETVVMKRPLEAEIRKSKEHNTLSPLRNGHASSLPLKSALRNTSRSPSPNIVQPPPRPSEEDEDNTSISSYETGHEMFEEEEKHVSERNGSSDASTEVGPQTPPKRRKSVRVSLKPQFSATPPAIEYDQWADPGTSWGGKQEKRNGIKRGDVVDMWADSSEDEEDVEYATARRLLARAR